MDILIETHENGYATGHTKNYIKAGIKTQENLSNQIIKSRITDISEDFAIAERA